MPILKLKLWIDITTHTFEGQEIGGIDRNRQTENRQTKGQLRESVTEREMIHRKRQTQTER